MRKLIIAFVLSALAGIGGVQAQTFPNRPITVIVPFPAGGSTGAMARILLEPMQTVLGQAIIIENVGGAGGSIGAREERFDDNVGIGPGVVVGSRELGFEIGQHHIYVLGGHRVPAIVVIVGGGHENQLRQAHHDVGGSVDAVVV